MMEFSLWKQLKKRLRRSKKPMWALGCLMGPLLMSWWCYSSPADAAEALGRPESQSVIRALTDSNRQLTVKLRLVYLCGEETSPLGRMNAKEVLGLLRSRPEWTAVMDKDGAVVMEQRVDDLSEACKKNAYMSIDKEGSLSLFEGPPKKEKVLRTFFQLDVQFMESSLPKEQIDQLIAGIRVTDVDDYNSILSTFSDYARVKSEKVMKPTY
ncbi:BofC C-terminal domain-containing protein [Paenibacillus oenotherae]|uniref:BofC C-terminal domain-containing protein n=1 Tax=Paenibacillus oenotherae TaxID=1435645 RepID=A0ABS7D8M9_9BACL|nr:BofC C-terminal domain-containing protein [Paenibacillus oenotherae]MBW7476236.1 BofC C-terminal domain-containing protein [Paenibacillus oenotherae]